MIKKDCANLPDCEIIRKLQNHAETFYLTGSRFFNHDVRKGSDYDFFVQHSELAHTFLMSLGFKIDGCCQYIDRNTVAVYKKRIDDISIDIQVVRNAYVKDIIQHQLKTSSMWYVLDNNVPKGSRNLIWDLCFEIVAEGYTEGMHDAYNAIQEKLNDLKN